jgi:HNH endonuclease
MIENPPSFVVRTELHKAAFDNGFRIDLGLDSGWLHFRSTTAKGDIWLAAASKDGPWLLAVGLASVATELGIPPAAPSPATVNTPAGTVYSFNAIYELHDALDRTYRLGVSLPDAPLKEFLAKTKSIPRTTEAERLVVQRVGQDVFRKALLEYWKGRCPVTGITDPALLRASHIVPWSECETDALRLDVHNGLLLSALWDAAFDAGLVSFDDAGEALMSPRLTQAAVQQLNVPLAKPLALSESHRENLFRHRAKYGFAG